MRGLRSVHAGLIVAAALLVAAATALAPGLGAQQLVGRVLQPDRVAPAPGVVVTILDARDSTLARALTGRSGDFRFRVALPGRYRVRAMRVGFRPTEAVADIRATAAPDTITLVLTGESVRLTTVTVSSTSTCRDAARAGPEVASAWEEARKALEASDLAMAGESPVLAEWIQYDRSLDSTGRIVRRQTVRTTRSPTQRAFRSAPAEQLARDGYVVEDSGVAMFFAPDASVLLSPSFAATHCFGLVAPPPGREGLLGIEFRPNAPRRGRPDIEGTFWLDRASAELRSLDFRYTELPAPTERAQPGGRVEFLRLTSGHWLVHRWSIRMPLLGRAERVSLPGRRLAVNATRRSLREIQVTGGEVTRVERSDTTIYRAQGSVLTVRVLESDRSSVAPGARIQLEGTDYEAIADSLGVVRFDPVLAGRYRVHARSAVMDFLAADPAGEDVDVRERALTTATIVLPTGADIVASLCGHRAVSRDLGLLYGIARDSAGDPVARAAVSLTELRSLDVDATQPYWTQETLGTLTGDDGQWRLCAVPLNSDVFVRIATDDGFGSTRARLAAERPLANAELTWRAGDGGEEIAPGNAALIDIFVTDHERVPVPDAIIELEGRRPPVRRARTDSAGRALVPAIGIGTIRVRIRRVGFVEGRLTLDVAAGRNTLPILLDRSRAATLDTVRVVGDRLMLARHTAFERRLGTGAATASITAADIARRNPISTWQMFTTVSSVGMINGPDGVLVISRRMLSADLNPVAGAPCYMRVAIDGYLLPETKVNLEQVLPRPSEIHGIEVFAGPARIPPEYSAGGTNMFCGLIVVWTK